MVPFLLLNQVGLSQWFQDVLRIYTDPAVDPPEQDRLQHAPDVPVGYGSSRI
jgi:hypothetical protein